MTDKETIDNLNARLQSDVKFQEYLKNRPKRPKYDGKVYDLRGFVRVFEKDGKMFAKEICSCGGCFDKTYEINEGDVIRSFKSIGLNGKLKNIKVISMNFITGENTSLHYVKLESHQSAIDFYCGGQMFDNYGIDGSKSVVQEGIKQGIFSNKNIHLPNAAK